MKTIVITTEMEYDYIQKCVKVPVTIIIWEHTKDISVLNNTMWREITCVVVAVKNNILKADILKFLRNYLSESVIIDFWKFYSATIPLRRSDRVLCNPCIKEFEGLIFGISHAEVGLLADMMKVPFANLAVSSQDIYYNYKTLKYALDKYMHKLQKVKYIIIDMYRYNYFNYDVSKSKKAMAYYNWSGFLMMHIMLNCKNVNLQRL